MSDRSLRTRPLLGQGVMSRLYRLCTATVFAVFLLAFAAITPAAGNATPVAPITPVGPISTLYVLHFAPEPRADVSKEAQQLLRTRFTGLKSLTRRDERVDEPALFVEVLNMKATGVEPPSVETLKYFGRGVTTAQVEAMQKSTLAVAVTFTYRAADALACEVQANAFMKDLAARTSGLIWDVETRQLFSPEALGEARLSPLDHGFPDIRGHLTIHAYQANDYVRAITLGMRKFGLPDLVVNELSWSLNNQMANTINLVAQALVEGATPKLGAYDLDASKTQHAEVRAMYEENRLGDNPQSVAMLTLAEAEADEGDPDNRLVEVRFDRYAGKTVQEKQQTFVSAFYGSVDTATLVKHNAAILAASERARKQLPALRKAFNAGLEPGERILLKAPFATPDDGNEYMWVEVNSWKGDTIRGLLDNDPDYVPDLRAGATVQIKEQDVFDYIRYRADGREEGNETGREIEKLQKAQ